MAISTRTRFEVFKRDGFRCHYCDTNAMAAVLHVDHVEAIANGGTDDPANLITACSKCNLGKSDVPLDESRLPDAPLPDELREHATQIRAYLAAVEEVENAKSSLVQAVIDRWIVKVDSQGMQRELIDSCAYWIEAIGLEQVFRAVDAVGRNHRLRSVDQQRKYYLACLRNQRDGA
jgi:hypothetical protein